MRNPSAQFLSGAASPLTLPVVTLITGIVTGYCYHYTPIYGICLVLLYTLAASFYYFPFKKYHMLLPPFFILSALVTCFKLKQNPLTSFSPLNKLFFVVDIQPQDHQRFRFKTVLKTHDISPLWVHVYSYNNPRCRVADSITAPDLLLDFPTHQDLQLYYKKEGVDATAFPNFFKTFVVHRPLFSLTRILYNLKEKLLNYYQTILPVSLHPLFASIFLGNKDFYKSSILQLRPLFAKWGLSHQLARSGLHLIFILPVCILLLSCIPLPFFYKKLFLIAYVALYCCLSWPSVSFLRASIYFFIMQGSLLVSIFLPAYHLFLLTTLLILLYNPLQLFFLDFQLSFFISFTLILINCAEYSRKKNI